MSRENKIVVLKHTITKEFKQFDFKAPQNHLIPLSAPIITDPLWRMFLNIIDTANISDNRVILKIKDAGRKVRIAKDYKLSGHPKFSSPSIISFSPVIISPAGAKAVVFMESYSGPDDLSTSIYFLEYKNVYPYIKRDPEWVVIYIKTLSLT